MRAISAGERLQRARIVSELSRAQDDGGEVLLYCPCAEGLTGRAVSALCLLPIHDANGRLLEALGRRPAVSPRGYAGIFAVDPFRRRADIFAALRLARFPGVSNFPSLCLIDGEVRNDLEELGFGFSREVEFIRAAVREGFSAAAVVDTLESALQMIACGASVLIGTDTSVEIVPNLAELAASASVQLACFAGDD